MPFQLRQIIGKMEKPQTESSSSSGILRNVGLQTEEKAKTNVDLTSLEPSAAPPQEEKKSFKFKLTIFMLCLISVIVAMDAVIVASTLPAIAVSLKGSSLEAFWVGTSYLLAQTVSPNVPFKFCIS